MHDKLLSELSKAMKSNPDFNILETIEYVLTRHNNFRNIYYNYLDNHKISSEHNAYRPSNNDITKALERFNNRK